MITVIATTPSIDSKKQTEKTGPLKFALWTYSRLEFMHNQAWINCNYKI